MAVLEHLARSAVGVDRVARAEVQVRLERMRLVSARVAAAVVPLTLYRLPLQAAVAAQALLVS